MRRDLRRTAHHEAGHAVAALALGHAFIDACIYPVAVVRPDMPDGAKGLGRVYYGEDGPKYPLIDLAITVLAGPVAEARYRHASLSDVLFRSGHLGSDSDVNLAKTHLENSQYTFRTAEDFARQVIRDNWPCVQRLAETLLTHHRVDYQTTLAIVGDTIRPRLDAKPTVRARPKLTRLERRRAKRAREKLARPRLF